MASAPAYSSDDLTIRALARMPFLERRELAAVASLAERTALNALHRLERAGFVSSVKHSLNERSRMRRWHLKRKGMERLAELERIDIDDALRRFPLSTEWRRSLLRRMDTVAILYRIARDASMRYEGRLMWRWERSGPLDALMILPDGRTIGMARFGSALPRRGMFSRLGSLLEMNRRNFLFAALTVVPGPIEAHGILEWMRGKTLNLSVSEEEAVLNGAPGDALWRSHFYRPDAAFPLRGVIEGTVKRLPPAASPRPKRVSMPHDAVNGSAGDLVSCNLVEPAARMLDVLADWPLMRETDMSNFLGISPERIRAGAAQLTRLGLAARFRVGTTPEVRRENGARMALSVDGLRHLAWRDRTRFSDLVKFWAVHANSEGDAGLGIEGFYVRGSKLRVLARELRHTDGVYRFLSLLATECRQSDDWELLEALPPHRWERWFRYNNRRGGVRPDATGLLDFRGRELPLLLEYEERATTPDYMKGRLLRYRNYYGVLDTQRDFCRRPVLLLVFMDAAAAGRLASFAARNFGGRSDGTWKVPMLVSSIEIMKQNGVLGDCWLSPSRLKGGLVRLEKAIGIGSC